MIKAITAAVVVETPTNGTESMYYINSHFDLLIRWLLVSLVTFPAIKKLYISYGNLKGRTIYECAMNNLNDLPHEVGKEAKTMIMMN